MMDSFFEALFHLLPRPVQWVLTGLCVLLIVAVIALYLAGDI
jgi:hypothetical protein